jgi:ADP-ribose pyrophosphatase YjhB (NUDIX family)
VDAYCPFLYYFIFVTQFKLIAKIAWIYIQNRAVLGARTRGKIPFYIPGGKPEGEENQTQALLREIKEELSVILIPESIRFFALYQAQAHGKDEGVLVQMHCYTALFEGIIKPASEIEAIHWLQSTDMNTELVSPVDNLILKDLHNRNLID